MSMTNEMRPRAGRKRTVYFHSISVLSGAVSARICDLNYGMICVLHTMCVVVLFYVFWQGFFWMTVHRCWFILHAFHYPVKSEYNIHARVCACMNVAFEHAHSENVYY